MATCYNHVIHARNRPWGRLKAEWVLGDPGQGSAGHLPHGCCARGFGHQEQKSKETRELPSPQGSGPSSSCEHRHPAQGQVQATHWMSSEPSCTGPFWCYLLLALSPLEPSSEGLGLGLGLGQVPFLGYTRASPSSRSQSKKGI